MLPCKVLSNSPDDQRRLDGDLKRSASACRRLLWRQTWSRNTGLRSRKKKKYINHTWITFIKQGHIHNALYISASHVPRAVLKTHDIVIEKFTERLLTYHRSTSRKHSGNPEIIYIIMCSAQRQVLHCKLKHQGCNSAQRQVLHCKLRNLGCSFTRDE